MKKVTLSFPDDDSLWSFKDKSRTVNIAIAPRRNTISGPFSTDEIDMALKEFRAIHVTNPLDSNSSLKHTEVKTAKPSLQSRLSQLLSLMNL